MIKVHPDINYLLVELFIGLLLHLKYFQYLIFFLFLKQNQENLINKWLHFLLS